MINRLLIQTPVINATSDLAFKIQNDTNARLKAYGLVCPDNVAAARVTIVAGRKYLHIIVGFDLRYFVELNTGTIYAATDSDRVNRRRSFGTVFTINDFNWGEYEAHALPGTNWTMVSNRNGYMTAVPIAVLINE